MGHGQLDNPDKIVVKDEGVTVGVVRTIDCRGAGVTAVPTEGIIHLEVAGGGGMGSHSFLGGFHYMGPAGGSGDVLTNIGSGLTPTFAPIPPAAQATHALLATYHAMPPGASGAFMRSIGSGLVPTFTTPDIVGSLASHDLGGASHIADAWADFLTKISDAVPIKVGDSASSLSLWAGHLGSQSAHFPYPIGSGGAASGAILMDEIRQKVSVASGYCWQALASGGVPTWSPQLGAGGGGMQTHSFIGTYHAFGAGASGAVLTNLGSGAIPTFSRGDITRYMVRMIAGASAPAIVKAQADAYATGGLNDDLLVNNLINGLTPSRTWVEGIRVIGDLKISNPIKPDLFTEIWGGKITLASGANCHVIQNKDIDLATHWGDGGCWLTDMQIQCDGDNQATGSAIYWKNYISSGSPPWLAYDQTALHIRNVAAFDYNQHGLHLNFLGGAGRVDIYNFSGRSTIGNSGFVYYLENIPDSAIDGGGGWSSAGVLYMEYCDNDRITNQYLGGGNYGARIKGCCRNIFDQIRVDNVEMHGISIFGADASNFNTFGVMQFHRIGMAATGTYSCIHIMPGSTSIGNVFGIGQYQQDGASQVKYYVHEASYAGSNNYMGFIGDAPATAKCLIFPSSRWNMNLDGDGVAVASGYAWQALASGGVPTWSPQLGAGGGMSTHAFIGTYHAFGQGASGNLLTCLGSGAMPTFAAPPSSVMATHALIGTYHAFGEGASGGFLTSMGSGSVPTFSSAVMAGHAGSAGAHGVIPFANLATHALLASFHALGDAPSGNFLTGFGSGNIPTFSNTIFSGHAGSQGAHGVLPFANLPTHALFASFHALGDAPSGNFLTGMGSGNIPTYSNTVFAGHVGSTGAHFTYPIQAAGIASGAIASGAIASGAHVAADHQTGGKAPLTIGSIPGSIQLAQMATHSLLASFHALGDAPSGNFLIGFGSGNIPTFSNAVFGGHVGSTGAHHTYPIPPGGLASGAVVSGAVSSGAILIDHLRTNLTVPSGYCWKTLTEGGIPTWSPDLTTAGGGMATHAFIGTYHAFGEATLGFVLSGLGSGAVPTFQQRYGKRSAIWFCAGTLAVGSQLSARIMADGNWTALDVIAHSRVPPSGANMLIDIRLVTTGTSIFGSPPVILNGSMYVATYSFATTGCASGGWLQLDLLQVGANNPGNDLTVQLVCREPII